jgi:hypothetical protein
MIANTGGAGFIGSNLATPREDGVRDQIRSSIAAADPYR